MASATAQVSKSALRARQDADAPAVAVVPVGKLTDRWAGSPVGEPNWLHPGFGYTLPREGADYLLIGVQLELRNEGTRSAVIEVSPLWSGWSGGCRWEDDLPSDIHLNDLPDLIDGTAEEPPSVEHMADGRVLLPPGGTQRLQIRLGRTVAEWAHDASALEAHLHVSDSYDPSATDSWSISFGCTPLKQDESDMGKWLVTSEPTVVELRRRRTYGADHLAVQHRRPWSRSQPA